MFVVEPTAKITMKWGNGKDLTFDAILMKHPEFLISTWLEKLTITPNSKLHLLLLFAKKNVSTKKYNLKIDQTNPILDKALDKLGKRKRD